ncbi:MAG: hypothetical protein ACYDCO_22245 [Armatimonadota bacterium]
MAPYGLLIFPITMVLATVASLVIAKRMMVALETIALTNALDEMEDRLSDVERADIEGRVRERLFEEGHFGCCGR